MLPYVRRIESIFIREVLNKLCIQTPRTSTFKELKKNPLVSIENAGRSEESENNILDELMRNPNVAISGVSRCDSNSKRAMGFKGIVLLQFHGLYCDIEYGSRSAYIEL